MIKIYLNLVLDDNFLITILSSLKNIEQSSIILFSLSSSNDFGAHKPIICYYIDMAKVALVQMVYNGMRYIPQSFAAMVGQTYADIEIVAVINGNHDGSKEYIQEHFPQVTIIDPDENLRFVRGHNLVFSKVEAEFYQLVNQDLVLEPEYVANMVRAFENPNVGAANGKIYQYDFSQNTKSNMLDTTGITVSRSGRGRSRGQHQIDSGQFDTQLDLISVDGAACMYRKSALESVKYIREDGKVEYYDLDFEMYWEDVDLGWRMVNAGWKCRFVPESIGYHGRTAAASPKGYSRVWSFIMHHRNIPGWILEYNYKNHIFLFIKNSPKWYWQFFVREFFYNCFVLVFETKTYRIVPTLFRQLPSIWKKRKYLQRNRKISVHEMEHLLQ